MNDIKTPLDFQAWIEEDNEGKFSSEELNQELNNFVEEFNNWLTANFIEESFPLNALIKNIKSLDLDNAMFEQYCDSIRVHSSAFVKPIRLFILENFYCAQYRLAVKRGNIERFDHPF